MERIEAGGEAAFNQFMSEQGNRGRSRWNLWHFSQFKKGDYIVVPLFDKMVAVCEVKDSPKSILSLKGENFTSSNGTNVRISDNGKMVDDNERFYDIGFVVPVEILKQIPRNYADALLTSRMKIRQTNARIDDLTNSVQELLLANGPVDIHEKIMSSVSDAVKDIIRKYITPDDLEKVVCWYFKKKGADRTRIPSKNEADKYNGADADVVAEFDDLGLVYYVQVKDHEGETNDWAVNQIAEYNSQKQEDCDGITYISWVVTTAGKFSPDAIELSKTSNVRLINGDEFIKMIFNVGLDGIEDAIKQKKHYM